MTTLTEDPHQDIQRTQAPPLEGRSGVRIRVRPPALRELVLAGAAMLAVVAVVMSPHILDGGFTLDDWGVYSDTVVRGGSYWDDIGFFLDQSNIRARPLTAVFWATGMNTIGFHMGVWLAFIAVLAAWTGTAVFAILRALGLGTGAAFAAGALSVLTPISDTLRLWIAAGTAYLPISLALTGVLLALHAFRTTNRRHALLLHGASVLLYACSLLFVEIPLVLMAGAVVLYLLVATRRQALMRSAVDLFVLGTIYLLVTSTTGYEKLTLGEALDHTWVIIDQARVLFTSVVLPFGSASWWALIPIGLLYAAAIVVMRSLHRASAARADIVRWLALSVGGVVVIAAGYAPYAFANEYYSPLTVGMGNRTNGLASVGWALLLVGFVMLVATLVFRGLRRERMLAGAAASVMLAAVLVSYVDRYREDAGYYRDAFTTASSSLITVKRAVVAPPADSMFYVSGQPLEQALGVPIFNTTWDLNGALKYAYDRYDVRGLPVLAELELACDRAGMVPVLGGVPQTGFRSAYRRTFFVDGLTGQSRRIDNAADCRDVSATWPRNPAQPPVAPSA